MRKRWWEAGEELGFYFANRKARMSLAAKLTEVERSRLRAYRSAVRQIHPLFLKYRSKALTIKTFRRNQQDEADLIPVEDFESLARALRLVYMEKEHANFYKVLATVGKLGNAETRQDCRKLKDAWKTAIEGRSDYVVNDRRYGGKDILDTWLNAKAFHQDADRQEDLEQMRDLEPMVSQTLQANVRKMVGCALVLDMFVADLLCEERLTAEQMPDDGFMF